MRPDAGRSPAVVSARRTPPAFLQDPLPIPIALGAGALSVFAFAPFGIWPLQVACVALLFLLVMRSPSVRRAAVLGCLYSFAWTCAGVHWLYVSLHDLGGLPAWLTALAIALLALALGLIVGAATGTARWLQQRFGIGVLPTLLLTLPALWMLSEWTRSWIFTGFPWLSTGLAHTGSPLAGFAPLVGVYGISWVAATIAAALAGFLMTGSAKPACRLVLLATVGLPLAGGQALRAVDWTRPHGRPISVRLLQGNIAQEMKFDPAQLGDTLGLYEAMITERPADLIATPETAIPVIAPNLPPGYLDRLAHFAAESDSRVLVGIPISDGPDLYTNGLLVLPATAGTPPYRYDKHHLVPFGEFIPPGFRWFVDLMRMPLGDQTRGAPVQPPFPVRDQWILPNICYEDLFGEEIAAQIRARLAQGVPAPSMMLNISNIAWFGDTIALPQHLQISRMRTLETGLPMLRATNTGATAVIGPHGQVAAQLTPFTRDVLATSVQGYAGITPYVRFGNAGIVTLAAVLIAAGIGTGIARRRRGA